MDGQRKRMKGARKGGFGSSLLGVVTPEFKASSFTCPNCRAVAMQTWTRIQLDDQVREYWGALCHHCWNFTFWDQDTGALLYPDGSSAPPANDDMSAEVRRDYEEASSILERSPRGSAALLRLAIQKICIELGQPGKNINTDIGALVADGLPARIQKPLDVVRVVGNESVHPGQIDLDDDRDTAVALFGLVNMIVDQMISQPRRVDALYEALPESKKKQIEERDKPAS
jgi:hypothetical protein